MLNWRSFFFRKSVETELEAELRFHLDEQIKAHRVAGMSLKQARLAARREFGGVEQVKEECRDTWGMRLVYDVVSDFQYGWRQLRKAPGFAFVAILTLAIGIGASTAIFSIVNNVMLQPLPYRDPGDLMSVHGSTPTYPKNGIPRYVFHDLEAELTSFESLGGGAFWPGILTGAGTPLRFYGHEISPDMLGTLGVEPVLGRTFRSEEYIPGNHRVVLLSHRLWLSQFQGRPDVVGEGVRINDEPWTVVGVMGPSFLPEPIVDPVIYAPSTGPHQLGDQRSFYFRMVGRLKPGVSPEQAAEELTLAASRMALRYPDLPDGWSVGMEPLMEAEIGEVRNLLWMLLGAVGFLLLIACVNVANLLLARATSGGKEIALRAALGAGRGRIIRQLLAESSLLALLGTVLGVGVSYVTLELLLAHAPLSMPRMQGISIDVWALLFSSVLAMVTGIGFGMAPALQASKVNLVEVMNTSARGSSAGGQGRRLRGMLVIMEFSLALVLLMAAGLLLHSFVEMQREPLGYDPEGSNISRIFMQDQYYPDEASRIRFVDSAVAELSTVPGVEAVVFASRFPAYYRTQTRVAIPGRTDSDTSNLPLASYMVGTLDYFRALGIPLEQGRLFDAHDDGKSPPVAVVSRGFARHFFPGEDSVGQQITIVGNANTVHTIVGVVGTLRDWGPLEETPFQIYVPYAQQPFPNPHLLVRVNREFAAVEPALRRALDRVDPGMPLSFNGIDLEDFTNELVAQQRYALFLFAVFSVVALLLCALGIYGVVAFSVSQRTKEVGIRMALGAQVSDILRLVIGETGRQMVWGLLLGLTAALFATRYLSSLLYKVSAHDPLTYVAVSGVLIAVALFACWLPARRATKVDAMVALRCE